MSLYGILRPGLSGLSHSLLATTTVKLLLVMQSPSTWNLGMLQSSPEGDTVVT